MHSVQALKCAIENYVGKVTAIYASPDLIFDLLEDNALQVDDLAVFGITPYKAHILEPDVYLVCGHETKHHGLRKVALTVNDLMKSTTIKDDWYGGLHLLLR